MKKKRKMFMKRMAAVILTLCMVCGMGAVAEPTEVRAMTTQSAAVQWARNQAGKSLDWDGKYGAQCMDLIAFYCQYLGVSPVLAPCAKDYASKNPPAGWQRIQGASIQAGDVVIWTGGEHGHVAIAISGDRIMEQNYASHKYCEENPMRWGNGYWGVWRPNFNPEAAQASFISYMKTPENGGNYSGSIGILGYALHKNGIRNVTAWVNGLSMDCPMYNSPDVAEVYPGYPTGNEGFSAQIPISFLKEGENEIDIYAYEKDDTPHLIASHKFNWNSFVGRLESPVQNGSYDGILSIQGYALHKNSIRNVTAWVNGISMDCPMYERQEIATKYSGYPTGKEGFKAEIPVSYLKNGENEISIYAYEHNDCPHNIASYKFNYVKESQKPVISDVKITDLTSSGYTVKCTVIDEHSGINRVQFPVWTVANDKDDLAEDWMYNPHYTGTQDGTTWSFRVNDKDHNFERGVYKTFIKAYDNCGNEASYEVENIVLQNTYSPVNTVSYNGHTYHLYNDILTWNEAKAKCEELGGHLVTITSAGEQEAVAGLIKGQERSGYWIGVSSKHGSTWVTGEVFSYSNWEPGEPNAALGSEDSYGIYTGTGTWNDWPGSNIAADTNVPIGLGFICEWDESLTDLKDRGKTELANYKNASDYRTEQQEELKRAIAKGTAAIEAASNKADISRALAEAKTAIDAIKTNAQLTAEEMAAHTHSYDEAWKSDNENHWKECKCGDKSEQTEHKFTWITDLAATVENTGIKHEECEICGYMRNEGTAIEKLQPTHTHSYGTDWKSNSTNHWKECECGAKSEEALHEFTWIIDRSPTEDTAGIKHEECKTCGHRRNEKTAIEKLPSTHIKPDVTATPNVTQKPEETTDPVANSTPNTNDTTDKNILAGKPGDVDGDGDIKIKDVQLALKKALNLTNLTPEQEKQADVDENGKVEIKDAQQILKKTLNLISEFTKVKK